MSDYRDDRGALRQRVEALEAELEKSQSRVADLESDLENARRKRDAPKPATPAALDLRRKQLIAAWGAGALLLGGLGIVVVLSLENTTRARLEQKTPVRAAPTVPTPAPTPKLAPWEASSSCRCVGAGDQDVQLVYRANGSMSFGGNSTYFLNVGLRTGGSEVLLAPGIETVPPSKLEGGETQLLMACTKDRMVLAFGHRVSAWGLADGNAAWSATLPAPVGQGKNGPLRIECELLDVKGDVVTIPHASGVSRISAKDGSAVTKTSGDR